MSGERRKKGLWLDPRAKLFLILICVLVSMFAPSLAYQFALVVLIAILGTFFGKWKYVIKAVCFYAVICILTVWIMAEMTGTLRTMFIAFLGLFHKVYACGMLAGIVLSTTKVNEFLSAMNRVHAPKKLVIPLAVMLRYIPTIQEDWRYIKDAMRMRDVSPSLGGFLSHPGMTVECIYVPLMMTASKAADELSIASVTRGIENPNPRTCLVQIKKSYMVMQDVNYELFADSVEAECSFGIRNPDQELVTETLEKLGLVAYRERHPNTLSGGQKQRVAVAVSMICGKNLLVFDEPTSGLDFDSMAQVAGLIRRLSDMGKVVFVVTHDFEFVCRTCSRVLHFDEGEMPDDVPVVMDALPKLRELFSVSDGKER